MSLWLVALPRPYHSFVLAGHSSNGSSRCFGSSDTVSYFIRFCAVYHFSVYDMCTSECVHIHLGLFNIRRHRSWLNTCSDHMSNSVHP